MSKDFRFFDVDLLLTKSFVPVDALVGSRVVSKRKHLFNFLELNNFFENFKRGVA